MDEEINKRVTKANNYTIKFVSYYYHIIIKYYQIILQCKIKMDKTTTNLQQYIVKKTTKKCEN